MNNLIKIAVAATVGYYLGRRGVKVPLLTVLTDEIGPAQEGSVATPNQSAAKFPQDEYDEYVELAGPYEAAYSPQVKYRHRVG